VAESVLHPREIDTLVDEPRRVRVTDLVWRVAERSPASSTAVFQIRRQTSAPRYSVGSLRQAGDHSRADRPVRRRLRSRA